MRGVDPALDRRGRASHRAALCRRRSAGSSGRGGEAPAAQTQPEMTMAKARAAATAKPSTNGRADALIAKMKAARGYIYPEWEFAARQDPDFVETYKRVYRLGLGGGKAGSREGGECVAD